MRPKSGQHINMEKSKIMLCLAPMCISDELSAEYSTSASVAPRHRLNTRLPTCLSGMDAPGMSRFFFFFFYKLDKKLEGRKRLLCHDPTVVMHFEEFFLKPAPRGRRVSDRAFSREVTLIGVKSCQSQ